MAIAPFLLRKEEHLHLVPPFLIRFTLFSLCNWRIRSQDTIVFVKTLERGPVMHYCTGFLQLLAVSSMTIPILQKRRAQTRGVSSY